MGSSRAVVLLVHAPPVPHNLPAAQKHPPPTLHQQVTRRQRYVLVAGTLALLAFSSVLSTTMRLLQCVNLPATSTQPAGLYLRMDGTIRCAYGGVLVLGLTCED